MDVSGLKIADATYYRTRDGRIVREGNTDAAFLVVRQGSELTPQVARIIAQFKAMESPPENKAIEWPSEAKRVRMHRRR